MKNRYRIVRDAWAGYEAQVKYWWFPFVWFQCFGVNTNWSIDEARARVQKHKNRAKTLVEYVE